MTTEVSGPAIGHQPKTRAFVSYARADLAFVERLEAALKARGIETLIDKTEIAAFEDWWRRIETAITRADNFVFVISPDSVASAVCDKEVAFALSLNKRLARSSGGASGTRRCPRRSPGLISCSSTARPTSTQASSGWSTR